MRRYEAIWEQIAKTADPEMWVKVTVLSEDQMQTIINMVQQEKSRANTTRKALSLPAWGRLEVKRDLKNLVVFFKLKNAGAQL